MYNFFKQIGGKFRLHIDNLIYFVNPEKKTVTAVAEVSCSIPQGLQAIFPDTQLPNGFDSCNSWIPFPCVKYSYTAVCAPGDEFNEETGKKVAKAGLESKAYIGMAKRLVKWKNRLFTYLNKTLEPQVLDFVERAVEVDTHNREHIQKITGNS